MAKKKTVEAKTSSLLGIAEKAIEKKYGKGIITVLGEHEDLVIDAISSGCLSFDAAIGIGGFARGRLYEIFGPNSSGKSTLALSVVMQALMRKLIVVYIDAEHALDPNLVRNMGKQVGVDADQIKLVQAYTGDDNLQIAEELMKTGEIDVVVIDSVSALLPKGMAEGEIGDNYIGLLARLMSKACTKLTPIANRTNTLLIFINQIRHDIGKWGDSRTPTGGEALAFYATGRVRVQGGESKASRILNDDGIVMGHESDFLIIKNKLSAPWRTAKINLIYGQGYDFVAEVVDLSIDFGLLEKSGAWFEINGEKINGVKNVIEMFKENKDMYNEYRAKCMIMLGLNNE